MKTEATLYDMVEARLLEDERNRNSDKHLTWDIWQVYYNAGSEVGFEEFRRLPSEEHISRIRRKIQNDEKRFQPTEKKVVEARRQNVGEWQRRLGYKQTEPDEDELKGQQVFFK